MAAEIIPAVSYHFQLNLDAGIDGAAGDLQDKKLAAYPRDRTERGSPHHAGFCVEQAGYRNCKFISPYVIFRERMQGDNANHFRELVDLVKKIYPVIQELEKEEWT